MGKKPSQTEKFHETARLLECDESEEAFDASLGKVARHKPSTVPGDAGAASKAKRDEAKRGR
jgi:hypothetical protein